MEKIKEIMEQSIQAVIDGDGEKYLSLVSQKTVDAIEKLGIDQLMRVSKQALEFMGEDMFRDIAMADIDQHRLVDGRLERLEIDEALEDVDFEDIKEGLRETENFLEETLSGDFLVEMRESFREHINQ